jgi:WD40 repeat protein
VGSTEVEAELSLGVLQDLSQYFREPHSIVLSPDGISLAYLRPKNGPNPPPNELLVKIWDLPNAREKTILSDPGVHGHLPPLAFSPDGRYLAAGSFSDLGKDVQPQVKLWEVSTGRLAHTLTLPRTISDVAQFNLGCVALAFTPTARI